LVLLPDRAGLEKFPPVIVVRAHGDPVTQDAAPRTRRAIEAVDRPSAEGLD
jgi:hypothetical protein